MATVIRSEQCEHCAAEGGDRSKDNKKVYDDGSTFCFKCWKPGKDGEEFEEDSEYVSEGGMIRRNDVFAHGQAIDIPARGLSKKTCEFAGYISSNIHGKKCHVANYLNEDGSIKGQKVRFAGKKFTVNGSIGVTDLYGKHDWSPSEKIFAVITEGEIDRLSVMEVCGTQYPVYSLPTGAASAKSCIKENIQLLSKYKHIVLMFDNDEAGQKAVQDCIPLFEPGKVKVAKLPLKDANAMLVAGRGTELRSAIFNASVPGLDSLLSFEDIIKEEITAPSMGMSWGFPSLDRVTYGIQKGGVYTIGAGSGAGKTTLVRDIVCNLIINENRKVVLLTLEQPMADVRLRMAGYVLEKPAHRPGEIKDMSIVYDIEKEYFKNRYIHDNKAGTPKPRDLYSTLRCYGVCTECDVIVVDNITQIVSGETEERKSIDIMMADMQRLAVELNITIIMVSHLSKPDGTPFEEGRKVTASALRGSQSIQSNSYFVLGLERNKTAEEEHERNSVTLRVLKDRFTGESDGKTISLQYDVEKGRLFEQEDFEDIL